MIKFGWLHSAKAMIDFCIESYPDASSGNINASIDAAIEMLMQARR